MADNAESISDDELAGDVAPSHGMFLPLTVLLISRDSSINDLDVDSDDRVAEWFILDEELTVSAPVGEPDLDADLQVLIRTSPRSEADWLPFLRHRGLPLADAPLASAQDAAVVVRCLDETTDDHRWIVFCFGGISRSIGSDLIDTRFGMIATLNKQTLGEAFSPWRDSIPESARRRAVGDQRARVRNIKAEVRDGHRHRMIAAADSGSPLQGLRFDQVSDLLHGVTVRTHDELMRDLTGGKNLKFSTYLESLEDFKKLARYLLDLRLRDDYRADWGWIDNIVPVPSRSESDEVLHAIGNSLGTGDEPAVEIVLPDWHTINAFPSKRLLFALPGEYKVTRALMGWDDIRKWLVGHEQVAPPQEPLLRTRFRARLEGSDELPEYVRISDLMVTEIDHRGTRYVVSDGEVYRVAPDYLARVDEELSTIPHSNFPFPSYTGGNEPDYLATVVKRSSGRVAVLDSNNITLPHQTAFEPCDIVTDRGDLVFAKLKGRSSLFSHLCTQAVSASDILYRVAESRTLLLGKVLQATNNVVIHDAVADRLAELERRQSSLRICLLLLGTWRGAADVTKLPLISRLILHKTMQRITAFGFTLEFCSPPVERGPLRSSN